MGTMNIDFVVVLGVVGLIVWFFCLWRQLFGARDTMVQKNEDVDQPMRSGCGAAAAAGPDPNLVRV